MTLILTDVPQAAARLCGGGPNADIAFAPLLGGAADGDVVRGPDGALAVWRALAPAGGGYRGDVPAARAAAFAGWELLVVVDDATASQFDVLRALAGRPRGLPADVAAVALTSAGCHGHRGRAWRAERGNLHLSLGRRLDLPAARSALALTALPAVAVIDALTRLAPGLPGSGIKWVNDILVDGRKLAGVLTATQTERGRVTSALFGIGLNVARRPVVPPTPFVPAVACLHDVCSGPPPTLAAMLRAVLAAVTHRLDELARHGPQPLLDAYRAASLVVGETVAVWAEPTPDDKEFRAWPPPLVCGRVEAIGPDLSLRIAGYDRPLSEGRLAFAEAWHRFAG